jgi:hypothetical protein
MEREVLVAEPIGLLESRVRAGLARHSCRLRPRSASMPQASKIGLHPLRELRMRIQNRADSLELANVLVAEGAGTRGSRSRTLCDTGVTENARDIGNRPRGVVPRIARHGPQRPGCTCDRHPPSRANGREGDEVLVDNLLRYAACPDVDLKITS